jgi:hypothetical protein
VPAGAHDITVKTNGRIGVAKRLNLNKGEIVVLRSVE